jgi:hypothetical protein
MRSFDTVFDHATLAVQSRLEFRFNGFRLIGFNREFSHVVSSKGIGTIMIYKSNIEQNHRGVNERTWSKHAPMTVSSEHTVQMAAVNAKGIYQSCKCHSKPNASLLEIDMVHRNFSRSFYVFLLAILCVSSVDAVDTLQVTTPDPLLEDWRWTEYDRKSGLAGKTIEWVYEDRDGNIWFATTGGAQKYDGLRWTTYTTEDGLAHNYILNINQTKDGAIWIGSGSGAPNLSAGMTRLVEASDGGRAEVKADTFDGGGMCMVF